MTDDMKAQVQTGLSDERIKTLATLADAAAIDARIAEDQAEALEQLHVSTALRELIAARAEIADLLHDASEGLKTIAIQDAEIASLTAELHRVQLGSIPADDLLAVERWAAMPGRKPAAEAFTAGVRRDIARVVEAATADLTAERDRMREAIDAIHNLAHEATPDTGIEMGELVEIIGEEDRAALIAALNPPADEKEQG